MVFQSLHIILMIKKTHIMHIIHREDPIKKNFRGEKEGNKWKIRKIWMKITWDLKEIWKENLKKAFREHGGDSKSTD